MIKDTLNQMADELVFPKRDFLDVILESTYFSVSLNETIKGIHPDEKRDVLDLISHHSDEFLISDFKDMFKAISRGNRNLCDEYIAMAILKKNMHPSEFSYRTFVRTITRDNDDCDGTVDIDLYDYVTFEVEQLIDHHFTESIKSYICNMKPTKKEKDMLVNFCFREDNNDLACALKINGIISLLDIVNKGRKEGSIINNFVASEIIIKKNNIFLSKDRDKNKLTSNQLIQLYRKADLNAILPILIQKKEYRLVKKILKDKRRTFRHDNLKYYIDVVTQELLNKDTPNGQDLKEIFSLLNKSLQVLNQHVPVYEEAPPYEEAEYDLISDPYNELIPPRYDEQVEQDETITEYQF